MCLCLFILIAGVALGQPPGSIVGWGKLVVAEKSALDNLVVISGGEDHSLGLTSNGTVIAWGSNFYGQLGDGTTTRRNSPAQIGPGRSWLFYDLGRNHTAAIAF